MADSGWCGDAVLSTWTNIEKALHFVHCKILNCITTEMLQKILKQNYTNSSVFSTSSHKQSFPVNLNSCYINEYSFSVSSQYFPQVAGQTVLPCRTQLILTKDFIKSFLKLFWRKFYHEQEALHSVTCPQNKWGRPRQTSVLWQNADILNMSLTGLRNTTHHRLYFCLISLLRNNVSKHGRLARRRKWRACNVGEAKEGL